MVVYMKKDKVIFKTILIIFISFFLNINLTYASDLQDAVCELSDEYKEWLNLPEEERNMLAMPLMCKVSETESIINNITSYSLQKSTSLPSTYDSRNVTLSDGTSTSYITSVKNQQDTGTCWAFAMSAVLESYILKTKNLTYDLSERHMEYTLSNNSYTDNTTYEKIFNRGIDSGGNSLMASAYYMSNLGAVSESAVPFINSSAPVSYSTINNLNTKQIVDVDGISFITANNNSNKYSCSDVSSDIKQMIMEHGAVSANVYMSSSYLNTSTSALYYNGTNSTDHSITIVGWDDNYSKSNFKTGIQPTSDGAWIVKNSWGEEAATMDEGYFYVSYEDTQICSFVTAITNADIETVDNIYQNEKQGLNNGAGYEYAANIFTREDTTYNEALKEVTVGAYQATDVTLYLVDNVTSTSNIKTSKGTKLGSISIAYMGYETLKLDTPIEITGEKFAIIAHYSNYTGSYPIGISMYTTGLYNTVSVNEGVSFVADDQSEWEDTSTNDLPYAVVLKAGTNNLGYQIEISDNSEGMKINNVDGGTYKYNLTTTNINESEELNVKIYNSSNEDVTSEFTINDSDSSNVLVTNKNGITTLDITVPTNIENDTYKVEIMYRDLTETTSFIVYKKKTISIEKVEKSLDKIYNVNKNQTIKYYLTFENVDDDTALTANVSGNNLNYDMEGAITNIIDGKATVTITINSADAGEYILSLSVDDPENGIISLDTTFNIEEYTTINNLSFSKTTSYLKVGDTLDLNSLLLNNGEDELNFEITSGSEYISLDNRVVTSKERGVSTITVTPKYQDATSNTTATIQINTVLSSVSISKVDLSEDIYAIFGGQVSYEVDVQDITDLYVKIYDENNYVVSETYATSNITKNSDTNYIVEITFNENNNPGNYKIEMTGNYSVNNEIISTSVDSKNIELLDEIEVTKVSITNTESYLKVGDRLDITAVISPSNATISNLSYQSSDYSIASFNNNTLIANSTGEVTITVVANNGVSDTKTFTIIDPSISLKNVTYEINENVYSDKILYDVVGGVVNVSYEMKNVTTTQKVYKIENNSEEEVSFNITKNTTSNVFKIMIPQNSEAGNYKFVVTALYTDDSGEISLEPVSIEFTINELIEVTSIKFDEESYNAYIDDEIFNISPIINNGDNIPTYSDLNYKSSNESVAEYENGSIKLLSIGSTTITVSSINGISSSFVLNVIEKQTEPVILDIFENSEYINNSDKYITNVKPQTTKSSFINNLNLDNVTYEISGVNSSTNYISTGTTLEVTQNNITTTYTVIIFGDVNGDGQIFANDYMLIKNSVLSRFNSNITDPITTTNRKLGADVNVDGNIYANDYMLIKNSVLSRFNDNITDPIKQNKTINGGN